MREFSGSWFTGGGRGGGGGGGGVEDLEPGETDLLLEAAFALAFLITLIFSLRNINSD